MKTFFLSILLCMVAGFGFAQKNTDKITAAIVAEGKLLYQSEMASWYGTDIFLAQYTNKENIGGYFSYPVKDAATCVFYSKGDTPKVIGTMVFDTSYAIAAANVDLTERSFTPSEQVLYEIRLVAKKILFSGDSLFKFYKKTNPNIIPLITKKEKKVYILTGPEENGVVIFGNDYLLEFDDNSQLISKKNLHKNIITTNYGEKTEDGSTVFGAMHTHLPETGDFITATDICTLMLYEKFAKWKQYIVMSDKYVSLWNCANNTLFALTREAWDKIYSDKK